MQCEFCHGKGNIIMLSGYGRPYTEEDSDAKALCTPYAIQMYGPGALRFCFWK